MYIYRHFTYRCICIYVGGIEKDRGVEELGGADAGRDGEVGGGETEGGEMGSDGGLFFFFFFFLLIFVASSSRLRFSERAIF